MTYKLQPDPDAREAVLLMKTAPATGRGRRSPVLVWMWKNRATLEAGFKETAPAWDVLADYLARQGVMDGGGKAPTPRVVRDAWAKVQSVKPVVQAAPAKPIVTPAVRTLPQPTMPETPPASDEAEQDPSLVFRLMGRTKKSGE